MKSIAAGPPRANQRRRDDHMHKICILEGGGEGESLGKIVPKRCFPGKFHDNKSWNFANSIQRAANGGSDPSWLSLAFLGRPDFPSRGPKTL